MKFIGRKGYYNLKIFNYRLVVAHEDSVLNLVLYHYGKARDKMLDFFIGKLPSEGFIKNQEHNF